MIKISSKIYNISLASVLTLGLIGVVVYTNFIDFKVKPKEGCEVGLTCPVRELKVYSNDDKNYSITDSVGKITIVNFWQTYCGPCVQEIPHFESIYQKYKEDVFVVAVHGSVELEDVPSFIETNWPGYEITFALDKEFDDGFTYYDILGGEGYYPRTIVLDREGVISAIHPESITFEILENDVLDIL